MDKKYYVAVYPNQEFKIAGMDYDSDSYPYPVENPDLFKVWADFPGIVKYVRICNYGKTIDDKDWLNIREFNYSVSKSGID